MPDYKNKAFIGLIALTAILFLNPLCFADDNADFKNYLSKLEKNKTYIFYSDCTLKTGKAVLIFPLGQKKGTYIEIMNNSVVNSGQVFLEGGEWRTDELLGGVYSVTRANKIIDQLLNMSFKMLDYKSYDRIFSESTQKCEEN